MKLLLSIFSLLLAGTTHSQLINPSFEEWIWIQLGQPYEDLVGWKTNNSTLYGGFANTPVTKGTNASGYFAKIRSADRGIDATGSGEMSQRISTQLLHKIDFLAKCDSLWQTGQCIVRLLGYPSNEVLYLDTMIAEDQQWRHHSIPILDEWTLSSDSITVYFIAKGGMDMFDEQEDGYSIFLVDSVNAEYITATADIDSNAELKIYPNPSTGTIHFISYPVTEYESVEIISLTGQVMFKNKFSQDLDLSHLPNGMYVARMNSGKQLQSQLFVLR